MAQKKKLQVFISSTYADLKQERQAAVEAILTAGHIPAGMELFAAGDESQMNVIKRWIDESDVYLLILGGRYGSIEPKSGKSYIHLEYEYAVERGKPVFAVVVTDEHQEERVRSFGTSVIETDHAQDLREFRNMVLNRIVRFWSDPREIKLAVMETLAEFSRRDELKGWIPGDETVNIGALAGEIARLTKENASLREQVARSSPVAATYNGLTFAEMYSLLIDAKPDTSSLSKRTIHALQGTAQAFGDTEPSVLHLLWITSGIFQGGFFVNNSYKQAASIASDLRNLDLIEQNDKSNLFRKDGIYILTEASKQFLLRLRVGRNIKEAEKFILPDLLT